MQIRGRLRSPPRPGLIPVDIGHGVGHLQDLREEGGHHKGQIEVHSFPRTSINTYIFQGRAIFPTFKSEGTSKKQKKGKKETVFF